jgi:DNA repair exonuclease SbcCD ATPase subunit
MIILQKLRWDNCFSYGKDNEIDLDNATLTQLVGTNGVGKSSVPLILEEVMFNKNSKNVKKADIANRYVNNGYDISLDFSIDGDSYNITVSRRATLKCKLTKNGEDISSHTASNTYKTLGELLGIDFKTFTQLVYQNTNSSLQFLTATDTNRKKFLIELLKLDEYVTFFERFKDAVRTTSLDIAKLNAKVDTIVKWLTDNKLDSMTLLSKMDLPKIEEKDERQLRSFHLEFENISEKNRKINDNNNLLDRLKGIDVEYAKNMLEKYPKMRPTQDLVSGLGGLDSQRERELDMSEKYETLREAEFQQCPTCEQEIDMKFVDSQYTKHMNKADHFQAELSEVHKRLEELDNENQIHRQAARNISDWEGLFRSIDSGLPTRVLDKEKVESQIRGLEDKVKAARETLEEVIDENTRRERHNTRISIIGEQTEQFETELAGITDNLGDIENKLSVLEILKKAFSTNGLLAYKIESLVKELESLTNEYLAEFSDGRFSINFVVENDKLNVEVGDNGKIIDILALSSGELARVNIATLVAIRKLMTSISRSQINVLFLDEVNQALDEAGKEKVVEILLKEETLNTFLVSHGWTHPLLEKIEILKEDNMSYLETS